MDSKMLTIALQYLCVIFVTATPLKEHSIVQTRGNDSGILKSLITVYALPDPGSSIYVKLYSRDDSVSNTFTDFGSVQYDFTAGASTKFWVDTIKRDGGSTKVILSAPVFGDGVPSKSGTWWVDSSGLKRTMEDANECPKDCATYSKSWRNL